MSDVYLTVDIGGTKTAVAIGYSNGKITSREEFKTTSPQQTLKKIIKLAKVRLKYNPSVIGISCGGPLNSRKGVILGPPNLPGWDYVEVVKILSDNVGIPAYLENDANAGALAEWMFGAGKGYDNIIFLTCGTGLGAGIILDGRLYRGKQDLAGEVGHIRMERFGPVGYFKAGALEGFASGGGIAQLAKLLIKEKHPPSVLDRIKLEEITAKEVAQAAIKGDKFAQKIITIAGEYLGRGISILIDILNPECIILGALAVRLGPLLIRTVRKVVDEEAIKLSSSNCKIVPAKLGERIGDVAALCAAIYNLAGNKKTSFGTGEK